MKIIRHSLHLVMLMNKKMINLSLDIKFSFRILSIGNTKSKTVAGEWNLVIYTTDTPIREISMDKIKVLSK